MQSIALGVSVKLSEIPFLASLTKEGLRSSEGTMFAALLAWSMAGSLTWEKALTIVGLSVGLGLYSKARSQAKG